MYIHTYIYVLDHLNKRQKNNIFSRGAKTLLTPSARPWHLKKSKITEI